MLLTDSVSRDMLQKNETLDQLLQRAAAEQDNAKFLALLRQINIVRAEPWLTTGLRKLSVRLPRLRV